MGVPQYTTPTITLTFTDDNLDLTDAANVYVTFKSPKATITKTGTDLTVQEKSISVFLTQTETGEFGMGKIEIQANWTTGDGGRAASSIVSCRIDRQLLTAVVV